MNKSEMKAPSCLECRLQDPFQTTDVPMNIKLYNPLCERIFKFQLNLFLSIAILKIPLN